MLNEREGLTKEREAGSQWGAWSGQLGASGERGVGSWEPVWEAAKKKAEATDIIESENVILKSII